MMLKHSLLSVTVLTFIFFSGCFSTKNVSKKSEALPAELKGSFEDDYGSSYVINDSTWNQLPSIKYHIIKYNQQGKYLIMRNALSNKYDPGLFTKIDVVFFDKMRPWEWGFCLTAYNAQTMEEAEKAIADKVNPKSGCNGYPFSRMKKKED